MKILAFDTCFAACSVAVARCTDDVRRGIVERFEPMVRGHAERLVPMIGETLAAARIEIEAIDRIAVTTGPGSFTGTRIGVAAARAFALGSDREIVALSSLEVIALDGEIAEIAPDRDLAVAMNANRGEVYVQLFGGQTRRPKSPPLLLSIEQAASMSDRPLVVTGSGAPAIASAAVRLRRDVECRRPDALPRIGCAIGRIADLEPLPSPPLPVYLRPPDAKPQHDKSLPRTP